jgi:hypothetical protein
MIMLNLLKMMIIKILVIIIMYSKNQRSHTLAREYLDKEFGGVPTSTFNSTSDFIFHSELIRHHAFSGWFDKPSN